MEQNDVRIVVLIATMHNRYFESHTGHEYKYRLYCG